MSELKNLAFTWWPVALIALLGFVLLGLWWRRRTRLADDEIIISDKDLYNNRYFEDEEDGVLSPPRVITPGSNPHHPETAPEPVSEDWEAAVPTLSEPIAVATPAPRPSAQPAPPSKPQDLIVAIYVRALRSGGFNGADIFAAMEQVGLRFGERDIFHHDGLDGVPGKTPVFSIANLLEPGTFNPSQHSDFNSPGLVLFMQLPGPLGGRVAFELMLHHAKRLAELLQGSLEDDQRQPVDVSFIEFVRRGIDDFEQRLNRR